MGWYQLVGMIQEAQEIDRQDASTPPTACPYDGTALRSTPDGKLYCPWAGDYTYPDDGIVA
jgi:hypothetical protein